jgi:hypothetical protein
MNVYPTTALSMLRYYSREEDACRVLANPMAIQRLWTAMLTHETATDVLEVRA